jgi:hypothetical protein
MRLIGGNISDTPVKEIGDGSAFSVGGSVADPDLVVLGSWGSATAISATNWAQARQVPSTCWASSGTCTGWIQLSQTKAVNVFRRNSDSAMYAGVIEFDSSGDIGTISNAAALSDFTTGTGVMAVRLVPGSSTKIVVSSADLTNDKSIELCVYDESSGSLSIDGAKIAHTLAANTPSYFQQFGLMVFDGDYGIASCYASGTSICGIPFRITNASQAFGTRVNSSDTPGCQDGAGSFMYASALTDKVAYQFGGLNGQKWTLTAGSPPTLAHTSTINSVDVGNGTYGFEGILNQVGSIIQAPNPTNEGEIMWMVGAGVGGWNGVADEWRATSAPASCNNLGTLINNSPYLFGRHNQTFVPIDSSGDWVRGVFVGTNGTSAIMAIPVNVNVVQQRYIVGTLSRTTNLTPHADAPINFGAMYFSGGPCIQVFCEDTAAAPSYIKLPVTV